MTKPKNSKPYWGMFHNIDGEITISTRDSWWILQSLPDTGPTVWPQNRVIGHFFLTFAGLRDFDAEEARDKYIRRVRGGRWPY